MARDFVEVVLRAVDPTASVTFVNTFHYASADPAPDPNLSDFLSDWIDHVLQPLLEIVSVDWTGVEVKATVVFGPHLGIQAIDTSIASENGVAAGTAEDYCYALILRRGDGTATREGRGRLFLGPVPNTYFDVKGFRSGAIADLAAAEASLLTVIHDGGGGDYVPILYHRDPPGMTQIVTAGSSYRAGIRKHRRYTPS